MTNGALPRPLRRWSPLALVLALVLAVLPFAASAQGDPVVATAVRGELPRQFDKHYLEIRVDDPTKPLRLVMDYEPQGISAVDLHSGFWVFNEGQFQDVLNGKNPASPGTAKLATGQEVTLATGLKQKVATIASPVGTFYVIVYNDATVPMRYTLRVENGKLVDQSGEQVEDATRPRMMETEEPAPATPPTPEATEEIPPTATPQATPTAQQPRIVVVQSDTLEGELPRQFAKHYYELRVTGKPVRIFMAYDPQDKQGLDQGLNFYVLDPAQFRELILGVPGKTNPATNNTAAGEFRRATKTRFAQIVSPSSTTYTVIVANDSSIPATYRIWVENGILVDGSGQSKNARERMGMTTPAAEETPEAAATPAPEPGGPVEVGSVYVVQRGDTLGAIARAAYGEVRYYRELCAYNNIPDCNRIEVGDEIMVPPLEELLSGATPTPETTPEAGEETPAEEATPEASPTPEVTPEAEETPVAEETPAAEETPEAQETPSPEETATPEATPEAEETPMAEETPEEASVEEEPMARSLVDVATESRRFEIFLLALDLAGLRSTLEKEEGPFTVFAPTDPAFAALPETTLDALLADPAELARVLQLHIVAGRYTAADLEDGMELESLLGETLTVEVDEEGTVRINGATVLEGDMKEASNGVLHAINQVLLPAEE